jgi:hypothetical protein
MTAGDLLQSSREHIDGVQESILAPLNLKQRKITRASIMPSLDERLG